MQQSTDILSYITQTVVTNCRVCVPHPAPSEDSYEHCSYVQSWTWKVDYGCLWNAVYCSCTL